ncbi:hypothetical protein PMIN06_007624 [Paraphaeosphaeria minitans]
MATAPASPGAARSCLDLSRPGLTQRPDAAISSPSPRRLLALNNYCSFPTSPSAPARHPLRSVLSRQGMSPSAHESAQKRESSSFNSFLDRLSTVTALPSFLLVFWSRDVHN